MSSTDSEIEVESHSTPQDDNPAASSNAETTAEKSTFDLVKEVMDGQEESPPSEKDGNEKAEGDADSKTPEPEKDPGELSEEDKRQLSKRTQDRINKLTELRKAAEARVQDLSPKAEKYDQIVGFTRENNLSASDIDNMFTIAAKMKTDPLEGFKMLEAVYKQFAQEVGAVLPNDLQEQVARGYISEPHARELAQTKAQLALRQQREDEQRKIQETETQQRTVQETVGRATGAADKWQSTKAKSDPDWHLKQKRVAELVELKLLKTRSFPKTEQEVYEMCDSALAEVENELKPYRLQKRAITPVTSSSSPRSVPEPKNTLDVIKNVLSGMD